MWISSKARSLVTVIVLTWAFGAFAPINTFFSRAFSLVKSNGWLLLPLELVTRWKVSYNNNDSVQSSHAFLFSFLIFYLWEGRDVNKIRIINCVSIRYGCYRYREIFAPTIRWFRFCFAMNECSFHWNNTYCRSFSKKCNRSLRWEWRGCSLISNCIFLFPSSLSFILSIRYT